MQIKLSSILVNNQENALKFYTEKLGFIKEADIPMGEFRWLTVISPEGPDDVELLLEPLGFEPAKIYQQALYQANIAATAFSVKDIHSEYKRLKALGVAFKMQPTKTDTVTMATFDDTCGNIIQIYQLQT